MDTALFNKLKNSKTIAALVEAELEYIQKEGKLPKEKSKFLETLVEFAPDVDQILLVGWQYLALEYKYQLDGITIQKLNTEKADKFLVTYFCNLTNMQVQKKLPVPSEEIAHVWLTNKIRAIRLYREKFGASLAEARHALEQNNAVSQV